MPYPINGVGKEDPDPRTLPSFYAFWWLTVLSMILLFVVGFDLATRHPINFIIWLALGVICIGYPALILAGPRLDKFRQ